MLVVCVSTSVDVEIRLYIVVIVDKCATCVDGGALLSKLHVAKTLLYTVVPGNNELFLVVPDYFSSTILYS